MKFILWTFVWFSLSLIGDFLKYGWPYYTVAYKQIGTDARAFSAVVNLFLWIYLYIKFVRPE